MLYQVHLTISEIRTHNDDRQWTKPRFVEKILLIVANQNPFVSSNLLPWVEKAIQKMGGLSQFARNSFLNLDTFKSCDLIGYKDSHWDLSKCSKMITWLYGFLCHLSHWWWVEGNRSVISCGLPAMSVLMSIILPANCMWRVNYIKNFIITLLYSKVRMSY